jgi:hypothetical protein
MNGEKNLQGIANGIIEVILQHLKNLSQDSLWCG